MPKKKAISEAVSEVKEIGAKDNVVLDISDMKVEYVSVDSIFPNPYNPNRQAEREFELLCRSMEEDGFTTPIIVREKDRIIVDGEHRWRAGQSIGMKEVPVVFVDMSDAQMRIATLRHNRARGSEDVELASSVLKDLADKGYLEEAKDSLLLDDADLAKMLNDIGDPEELDEYEETRHKLSSQNGTTDRSDMSSSSEEISDSMREERDKIRDIKTREERYAALRDMEIYRLTLSFFGEEAVIIKKALGNNVAEGILSLCTKEHEKISG